MSSTTKTSAYGDLCDAATGKTIRPATRREAEQSCTVGHEGYIKVNGTVCYVDGPVIIRGRVISHDNSGVGHNWRVMHGLIDSTTACELAAEIDDQPRGGKACIGGEWYRW